VYAFGPGEQVCLERDWDISMTAGSVSDHGTVLAGVKAKPSGWPSAQP
jgi:hypothetical protein